MTPAVYYTSEKTVRYALPEENLVLAPEERGTLYRTQLGVAKKMMLQLMGY